MIQELIPHYAVMLEGQGGLPKVVIKTEWSDAEIYLHGAHVTHFQKKGETPLLFLSELSEFESSKPIRGGIPIIFPWFGPREGFPAHGYARTTDWKLKQSALSSTGEVMIHFLLPSEESLETELIVRVAQQLSLEMIVTNRGENEATFENCLHTYFQIGAIDSISIEGLTGSSYLDKVTPGTFTEAAGSVTIASEVDRVYLDTTATIEITDRKLGRTIRVAKSGSNSTVVWNPWIAKSQRMPDFGDAEYLQMLCVESGNLASNKITLAPGAKSVMTVEISNAPPA